MTFKVKITENRMGGEIFSWHLQTKRGDGHWFGIEIKTSDEMIETARVLLEKAKELESDISTPSPTG